MALFDAQLGARPRQPDDAQARPTAREPLPQPAPIAGALGPRPQPAPPEPAQDAQLGTHAAPQCPLCHLPLRDEAGLWRCQGGCGTAWLALETGALVDLARLPYGICACCRPPQALARSAAGAICPASGQEYVLLPEGPRRADHAAPHGCCQCCIPAMPLVVDGDRLVCRSRRYNQYVVQDGQVRAAPAAKPGATSDATLAAIDAALRRNAARVTVHGLFDLDEEQ